MRSRGPAAIQVEQERSVVVGELRTDRLLEALGVATLG
jgi:hypothetical protein